MMVVQILATRIVLNQAVYVRHMIQWNKLWLNIRIFLMLFSYHSIFQITDLLA